jgi:serine/threonine protein kinase
MRGRRLDDFLERPIAEVAAPLVSAALPDPDAIEPDARIGPYRVVHELGRGGMGVVYLAQRTDGGNVALKIMRQQLDVDETTVARFRQECGILASLEHPGIARLLENGTMPDGRQWFAMEYVDGIPIDAYVEMKRLAVRARLELFAKLCDAVQHAHARQVIHRDIKPSNILVTGAGEPKLLDFGIAKPTSPLAVALRTRTGHGRLTREYASPEQLSGKRATATSDVYALGLLLFLLLTGRHPRRPGGWRRLLERLGLSAPNLGSDLTRELDAVIAKALQRNPRRRYATAGELGAAVRF